MHRKSPRKSRTLAAAAVSLAALVATALPASAQGGPGSGVLPDGGVQPRQPTRLCGRTIYETARAVTEKTYFNVYNGIGTCMTVDGGLDMRYITVEPNAPHGWEMPNISSGWEWGRNSCNGHSGACIQYPTPMTTILRSYHPRSGMQATVGRGAYNLSWDIWTDPTPRTSGQDSGTELMIWLYHPSIGLGH